MTMCRALYTLKLEEYLSKKQAALWAEKELPEWSSLIQQALSWRDVGIDHGQRSHKRCGLSILYSVCVKILLVRPPMGI